MGRVDRPLSPSRTETSEPCSPRIPVVYGGRDLNGRSTAPRRGLRLCATVRVLNKRRCPFLLKLQSLKSVHEVLREDTNLGRLVAPALVRDVDRQMRQLPVRQKRYEAPGNDVLVDDIHGLYQDAIACKPGSRAAASP